MWSLYKSVRCSSSQQTMKRLFIRRLEISSDKILQQQQHKRLRDSVPSRSISTVDYSKQANSRRGERHATRHERTNAVTRPYSSRNVSQYHSFPYPQRQGQYFSTKAEQESDNTADQSSSSSSSSPSSSSKETFAESTTTSAETIATTATPASPSQSWEEFTREQESHDVYVLPGATQDLFDPEIHMPSAPKDWTGYEPATPLWKEIMAEIGVTGKPWSMAKYMRSCLTDPQYGYYTRAQTAGVDEFDQMDDWEKELQRQDDPHASKDENFDPSSAIGGDFVTAPEVSNMFGECLGCWITYTADQQGLGKSWQYVEAGPGKGTLLVDLMRCWNVLSQRSSVGEKAIPSAIHLLEKSPILRQAQKERLQKDLGKEFNFEFHERSVATSDSKTGTIIQPTETIEFSSPKKDDTSGKLTVPVYWHDTLYTLKAWQEKNDSRLPTFFICQEFMDALPIFAFQKTKEGWRERMVDVALSEELQKQEEEEHGIVSTKVEIMKEKPRLRIILSPEPTAATKSLLRLTEDGLLPTEKQSGIEAPIGTVMEVNPEAMMFTQDMGKIVSEQGGGALIIDYGQEGSKDSIRAFSQHKQLHFLSQPGQVDVTADVDFGALKQVVNSWSQSSITGPIVSRKEPAMAFGPVPQGSFLMSLGIKERALKLIERDDVTEEEIDAVYQALLRLCSGEQMGERFKVLSIVPTIRGKTTGQVQPPPGFAATDA